jgi:hypothetical protein
MKNKEQETRIRRQAPEYRSQETEVSRKSKINKPEYGRRETEVRSQKTIKDHKKRRRKNTEKITETEDSQSLL